ncbi:hypothetical protein HWQ46_12885 [Shewanella sp. D64]|uniref:hypothetical protein n=1 Tax=unclassified Shewanella TaxID=196818 RepID=UPI0022BA169B|nr:MULTISPECIES: hypothetical protein [unclassified Shewanella]MEC4726445.1 hypothetical protein [Shewanella sp. D64]MEC4738457.1 hypothetical protein [Shewanella sp. E94]WBJ94141.1 hypothetical protein HWQ47_19900 [Shewanella sp. MTB7]
MADNLIVKMCVIYAKNPKDNNAENRADTVATLWASSTHRLPEAELFAHVAM